MPFAYVNNKDLFYRWVKAQSAANQEARTIVMIHGLGSTNSMYHTIIPHLTKDGFSCLAIDTYGSGMSTYKGGDTTIESIAKDGQALATHLGILSKEIILIGHSFGGLVVAEWASEQVVAGMITLGSIHPAHVSTQVFEERITNVQKNGMEPLADTIPSAAVGSAGTNTHRAFIRGLLLSQAPDGYVSLCRAVIAAKVPNYAHIRCPVLVVHGQDDKTATSTHAMEIVNSCRHAAMVSTDTLPGVGHWHCVEAPEELAAIVQKFVADNS